MYAAVHIAVVAGIIFLHGADHLHGLLGSGPVIQVHKRVAVHGLLEDREIIPDQLHIRPDNMSGLR